MPKGLNFDPWKMKGPPAGEQVARGVRRTGNRGRDVGCEAQVLPGTAVPGSKVERSGGTFIDRPGWAAAGGRRSKRRGQRFKLFRGTWPSLRGSVRSK